MSKSNNLTIGIICILISALGFSFMSFFVKISGDLPVIQKAFFRNLIAGCIALVPIIKNYRVIKYPKGNKEWTVIFFRAVFGTIGLLCNFYAVSHLHLADASVIQRISPFVIILLSYFIFNEKITIIQIFSIIIAFFGVLLIIKPGFEIVMTLGSLAALGTAIFSGSAYTCIRYLGLRGISAEFVVCFFSIFSCVSILPFVILNYKEMTIYQFFILFMVGITGAIGQFGVTYAYRYAAANSISIFDYTQIIFSGILGFIYFSEIPDTYSIIGYLLIVLTGFFISYYKR